MNTIKINKWVTLLIVSLMLLPGFVFTACDKDDDESDKIILNSFGPSPALRGGELRFIGINLNKVESVVLPGTSPITDITIVNEHEIKVTIPQDATEGIVTLNTPQGEIKTLTILTYEEPIVIEGITDALVKAGSTFTIDGDYLNLIREVIFFEGVVIPQEEFVSQTRKKIEVIVPAEAQPGKIIVSNGAEIPIEVYSDEPARIVEPKITSISPLQIKAGSPLKITGSDLDLVASVLFGGDKMVEKFDLNEENTEITVTVPLDAQDGNVKLVAKSEVEYASEAELIMILPTELQVKPTAIKNGATITISGKNLDLVTKATFGDLEATITETTESQLSIVVPETASTKVITLTTASEKTVDTPGFTYVKPVIKNITPLSLMAGNEITITGTDLDLVRSVIFAGAATEVSVTSESETTLTLNSPTDATSGTISLVAVNGDIVESTQHLDISPADVPVITSITLFAKPGAMITIEGTKLHLVESVIFENDVKATSYGNRTENLLEVYVPNEAKKGVVTLKLMTFSGKEIESPEITISGTDPVVDPSYLLFDFDEKNSWWGDAGANENNPDLAISGNYFRINQTLNAWWTGIFWRNSQDGMRVDGVTIDEWAVKMDVNVLGANTGTFKFRLSGKDGDFWGVIPSIENRGGWYTITIPLTSFLDGDGYGSNHLPNVENVNGDFGLCFSGSENQFVDMCIDNVRFEKIK